MRGGLRPAAPRVAIASSAARRCAAVGCGDHSDRATPGAARLDPGGECAEQGRERVRLQTHARAKLARRHREPQRVRALVVLERALDARAQPLEAGSADVARRAVQVVEGDRVSGGDHRLDRLGEGGGVEVRDRREARQRGWLDALERGERLALG